MDPPRQGPAVSLENELTCSICAELLYQPLTLLDCLHTFCGACVKNWFRVQAIRAENAPTPPPDDAAVFTCPSCREPVRDTKHDARVTTLLDMFLALNPDKVKSEADRTERDEIYKKGEKVIPKLSFADRTPEQRRLDEEERRLLAEVQELSLREAVAEAAAADAQRTRRTRGESRTRNRRDPSTEPSGRSSGRATGGERRRRSESRQRTTTDESEQRRRRVEHQSSLRSLINTNGLDSRDMEKEIEDFARQIQEEGLLDGLDLDNLDLSNNDELSRKITEAYRRRHRERLRQGGGHSGRGSNASNRSHRSDISSTRPRSRTDDTSRPTSRHSGHSRAPSASSSGEDRGRYPPSASSHLEVQEPRRRRRTSSGSRSATAPIVPTQPDLRVGRRSQTDLSARAASGEHNPPRPAMATITGGRSTSSPTTVPPRPSALILGGTSPNFSPTSGPLSPSLETPPLPSPQRSKLPRYPEPFINCNSCNKQHIEYELHYNCFICRDGDWNLCRDCWRRGKGCLHWFGFGYAAWARWEKRLAEQPKTPPPHMLTASRYLPPKQIPGGAEGRRTLTTDNPKYRLQSGTFCCLCSAWSNECYWRCEICNEGDWGFCNDCVNQGKMCTHALLPMSYQPLIPQRPQFPERSTPPSSPHSRSPKGGSPARSPVRPPPPAATVLTRPNTAARGDFKPLTFNPPCEVCKKPIPPQDPRFHCNECPSRHLPHPDGSRSVSNPGDYNICQGCYSGLVTNGTLAAENGPNGWRRCPNGGHRMVVVKFIIDELGAERRVIVKDYVGGRRLQFEPFEGGMQICRWWKYFQAQPPIPNNPSGATKTTDGETSNTTGGKWAPATGDDAFPRDGGEGPRGMAGWSWYPQPGADDELMFPKGAEIVEIEDVNGDWCHGFYMGGRGLFPAPYVRFGQGSSAVGLLSAEEV
ncbi:E3 ubiquitin-protein ligase [Naviculisporaceae sp. PSN 640]